VSLNVSEGKKELISLIGHIDRVLEEFGFPTYYKNPSPHVSIAWLLGDIRPLISQLPHSLPKSLCFSFEVDSVCCKIGKWIYKFKLL
jgi:2'-5' RNA ligase